MYCETGHPWLFMAEPVNTITNAFIILAAILAFRQVRNARIGWPADIVILLFLLFATGIGSFAWHAFRTRVALAFDAIPGLLFLFVFTGVWIGRLFGRWAGILGAFGLLIAAFGSMYLTFTFYPGIRAYQPAISLAPAYATISVIGSFLVWMTVRKIGWTSAQIVSLALVCAIFAAICRSVDLMMCSIVPFGTHFAWHILLSTAAYLAIVFLIRQRTRLRNS
ncbi:MAG TPA: ceramidase domain-containing protein [Rhizomicrobium sp.]|jgi:hypothetical protein|nr:ceramidase domain-containing protein [Rhizomicrobium sp.]